MGTVSGKEAKVEAQTEDQKGNDSSTEEVTHRTPDHTTFECQMRFMKAYSVFPTVSDSNKGTSRSVQFSISWPDNGRVGQCGKLHVVDQLCRSCNRGWNGWSFKQLQASRIGYDSDTGELQATPAQLEHVGGDDEEEAATGVGYCRLSENEVPKCFEMRCKVCQVSDGLLEGPPVDMRLIQKA